MVHVKNSTWYKVRRDLSGARKRPKFQVVELVHEGSGQVTEEVLSEWATLKDAISQMTRTMNAKHLKFSEMIIFTGEDNHV